MRELNSIINADYFASNILNTPIQQIIAPTNKIIHEANDNHTESKAKRKKAPIILIATPTKIVM